MDEVSDAFAGAFHSERLLYRAIDPDNADEQDFHYKELSTEHPVNFGLASIGLFRPQTKKAADEGLRENIKGSLLAVWICLPPPSSPSAETEAPSTEKEEQKQSPDVAKVKEPIRIGALYLSKPRSESFALYRRTMIGIQVVDQYQGKGYGREAINWALDWAFLWAGIHRVDIGSPAFNERAVALYEKIGFKVEGRVREAMFLNGQWWDMISMGMLEREWKALRGRS